MVIRRIQSSASGRAGIVGNPTDMYGGSVISCSTMERAKVSLCASDRLILETGGARFLPASPEDFTIRGDHFDIARAVLSGADSTGVRLHITWETSIPFRAGLSGSTALVVSMLAAVSTYRDIPYSPYQLAERARMIEYQHLGVFCGYQDAYMCTFGGLNYMDFRDKEFHQAFGTDPYATIEPLIHHVSSLPFTLVNTGSRRISGAIHKPIRQRWLEGEREVVDAYLAVGKLAREGKKAILQGQWEELGRLMNENHRISKSLGGSSPEDDRMIRAALDHGALGAKLAGSGGTIIALHPEPDDMIAALRNAGAEGIMLPRSEPGVLVEESE